MGLARKKEIREGNDALLQIRERADEPSKTVCKGSGPQTASQSAKASGKVASYGIKQRCRGAGCGSGSRRVTQAQYLTDSFCSCEAEGPPNSNCPKPLGVSCSVTNLL